MDTQNFFPNFKPNQVLTNTQLNQLRQYLDGQTRLSRVKLTGTGIVCGLFGNLAGGSTLRITGGFGITSDGFIIETENSKYTRFRNYTDPKTVEPEDGNEVPYPEYEPWRTIAKPYQQIQILELLSDELLNAPDFVEIEDNPSQALTPETFVDQVLVLYLEMIDDPLKSCIVTDCNNKGENVVFTVRVLLIHKDLMEEVKQCGEADSLIYFPRLITYLQSTGKTLAEIENSGMLNTAYKKITDYAAGEIYDKVKKSYNKYKAILNLDPEFQEDINKLQATLAQINGPGFNQYQFDFIRQLATAFNEFAQAICPLVKDCSFDGVFPRHLMLRDFILSEGALTDSGKHRHNFVPSPARNVIHEDLEKAQKLFIRIMKLAKNQDFGSAKKLKITPGQNLNYELGERSVPHFYKLEAIESWWQPGRCCTIYPPIPYQKNKMEEHIPINTPFNPQEHPLHIDQGRFSFYNIEGHLGEQSEVVIDRISKLKKEFNLEFDVVPLSFDKLQGGNFNAGLEPIKEILESIEELRKLLEKAINEGVRENADVIQELIGQITEKEESLMNANKSWISDRKNIRPGCNISHLQADYLQLRSELICTYDKILAALDKIPDTPPPQGSDTCVTFDNLENEKLFDGDEFPAGSEIFSENNIPVTMHDFFWSTGGIGYNWARAQQASAAFGDGIILWTNNVNIGFDFSKLETLPNKVTFYYKNDGGNENIQVNDGERVISRIKNGEGEIAPNVNLQVTLIDEAEQIYMAALTGEVQMLKIGGQEFSIDQVCALYEEQGVPSISMKYVNLKKRTLERSIEELEGMSKPDTPDELKKEYSFRIKNLKTEKSSLDKISYVSHAIAFLNRDVLMRSNSTTLRGNADGSRVLTPLAGGNNPMQDLVYSLYFSIMDLKTKIRMLLEILPKDVLGFNYLLYTNIAKEIMEQLVRIRLIVNFLLDMVVAMSGTATPLMRFLAGPIISMLVKNLAQWMEFLNAYQKIRYNCFPAELATIYYHLEHLLNAHVSHFGKFAEKHPGMEHLAGVPKGGTFIIVSEKAQKNQLVRADFALLGKVECCCEIDPADICLPPIAGIDPFTIEVIGRPESGTFDPIAQKFDVLKNDLHLNSPGILPYITLRENTSRMGANLSVVADENGRRLIRYEFDEPQIGMDEFSYELSNGEDGCELSDTGKVIILIRQKSDAPAYTGEDIAVTHINQPVDIDVALNDVANPQLLYTGYALITPATTSKGNSVQVISIENGRQALRFFPNEGFMGRDSFTYTISAGSIRAAGMVTVLVIPCCDGNATFAPGTIQGFVTERTLEGLQGTLSGGNAALLQGGVVLKTSEINKGQFSFNSVQSGTYDVRLSKSNPATGQPSHQTQTLTGINLAYGQTLNLDPVELLEIADGSQTLNVPALLGNYTVLTQNLGDVSGLEKTQAETVVVSTMTPRIVGRVKQLNDVENSGVVTNKKAVGDVAALVSGEKRIAGENTLAEYKKTADMLMENYSATRGAEKNAYRTLISVLTQSMLDDIAMTDINELSKTSKKQLSEFSVNLKQLGISVTNLKTSWKSSELKNTMKLSVVTGMNQIFS